MLRTTGRYGHSTGLVEKINCQYGLRHAPNINLTHEDIFDCSSTARIGLETERTIEVGAVHVTVLHKHVANIAQRPHYQRRQALHKLATIGHWLPADEFNL